MQSESSLEISFVEILNKLHIQFVQQFKILRYRYDFYLPEYNTLIEINGGYWHSTRKSKENDAIKISIAQNYGLKVKTFWEEQILFDPESVEEELLCLIG